MLIKDVINKFHKRVPFPLSVEKIESAGYNVSEYFMSLCDELKKCDDYNSEDKLIKQINFYCDEIKKIYGR